MKHLQNLLYTLKICRDNLWKLSNSLEVWTFLQTVATTSMSLDFMIFTNQLDWTVAGVGQSTNRCECSLFWFRGCWGLRGYTCTFLHSVHSKAYHFAEPSLGLSSYRMTEVLLNAQTRTINYALHIIRRCLTRGYSKWLASTASHNPFLFMKPASTFP